ncbi:MAG: hypothetical protein UR54_C0005G0018 [Candidatus Roizmanbacteria bacterium GW2011_GWA2_34_18]|uniref:Uncharacterized protein n=1 Tax=Candidatus Roizmanbacteria bacterium GW2011_GWA2_34_18 TaxID=1618477 RepID=A0A0G0BBS3_9BACT|nr:MAG: hypothetical protein UR54_C0005G0018 [Candidatus Roizmanbacteria bacterium GW2011_GWA2_34_18]
MQNIGENPNRVIKSFGKHMLAISLLGGTGELLANILVNTGTGAILGHINAGCAVNLACNEMVINTVKILPILLPALYGLGNRVKNVVVAACSRNPNGGTNQSIKGQIE